MLVYKELFILLITLFLIYKLLKKEYDLFSLLLFTAPFTAISFNLGLSLTLYQFLLFITLIIFFFEGKVKLNNQYIYYFLFYSVISTIFISNFIIDKYLDLGNYLQSEGRFITQIILLILNFSIIFVSFKYIKRKEDIYKYLRIILLSMIFLSILGWLQFTTYYLLGIDIFPIRIKNGFAVSGIEQTLNIFRISSLSHEPKGLSVFLTIGFFILYILNKNNIKVFKYDFLIKILFAITIIATLSTSGIVLFFLLLFIIIIWNINYNLLNFKKIFIYIVLSLFILIFYDIIYEIIKIRILDRDLSSEDFDAPIQIFLSKFPEYIFFGSGMGNIHNLAESYIPTQYIHYMKNEIFVAKSGYLRLISEYGLIGFFLFLTIIFYIQKKLKVNSHEAIDKSLREILILTFIAYLARSYAYELLIIIIAITNVFINLEDNKCKST